MDQGGQCSVPKGEGRAIWIPFFTTQWLEDFTTGPAHDATENRFFKAWQNLPSGVSVLLQQVQLMTYRKQVF